MDGFKNETLNKIFESSIAITKIIAHLIQCSAKMKSDCIDAGSMLKALEDVITNELVEKYLNDEFTGFTFVPQPSVTINDETGLYTGRPDIVVFSFNRFLNPKAYFIIECKRIDGTPYFNREYIIEGVARFFDPPKRPKYPSYYNRNIMFGYIIKALDVPHNASKIEKLQQSLLKELSAGELVLTQKEDSQHYVYTCEYTSTHVGKIELRHLFFNFSDIIATKS
ncbi:MAG: hypothetical protein FWB91_02255 [Defluviitaleaceae bacterium]|nr:hypothetical protein [Defluviitaleaceae bacterium]